LSLAAEMQPAHLLVVHNLPVDTYCTLALDLAISETLKSRNSTESSEYRVWALFTASGILQEFVQGDSDLPQSGKSYQ